MYLLVVLQDYEHRVVPRANPVANTTTSRIRDFTRMNPPLFSGSKSEEDPQEFFDHVQKVIDIMGVNSSKSSKLFAYQLQDISHTSLMQKEGMLGLIRVPLSNWGVGSQLRSECKSDKKETKLRCRNLICIVRISFFSKREYLLSLFQSDKFKLLRQSRSLSSRFMGTVSVFCGRSSEVALPTSRASTKAGEILIYCCGFSNRRGIESLDTGALSYLGLIKGQSHSAVT
ncbi:hypothetical protein FXO38_11452 [Capsicum annuum]|nr:hypothetical protein FXO38_11452 [Capsicum annuum]